MPEMANLTLTFVGLVLSCALFLGPHSREKVPAKGNKQIEELEQSLVTSIVSPGKPARRCQY